MSSTDVHPGTSLATYGRMGLLALVWGSSFLWIKLALRAFSPVQLAFGRLFLGAVVLVALAVWRSQRAPRDRGAWLDLGVAALLGSAVPFVLFGLAEHTLDSGVTGVINSTVPLWALLIGIAIGTDRDLGPRRYLGLFLGFVGVLVIFAPWHAGGLLSIGALEALVASISYAVSYAYIARRLSPRGLAPGVLSAGQVLAGSGLALLAVPVAGRQVVHLSPVPVFALVMLGVFGTGVAYALNHRLIADEGATVASSVGYLLPVVAVLLGVVFLGEPLSPRVVVGMIVVLVGVGLSRRTAPRPSAAVKSVAPATAAAAS